MNPKGPAEGVYRLIEALRLEVRDVVAFLGGDPKGPAGGVVLWRCENCGAFQDQPFDRDGQRPCCDAMNWLPFYPSPRSEAGLEELIVAAIEAGGEPAPGDAIGVQIMRSRTGTWTAYRVLSEQSASDAYYPTFDEAVAALPDPEESR